MASVGLAINAGTKALSAITSVLLSAHNARVKGAKSENAALASAVPGMYNGIVQIAQSYASGAITGAQAISACEQLRAYFWSEMAPYESGPGQHATACASTKVILSGGSQPSGASNISPYTPCNKSCTASCCVGCNWIAQWFTSAESVFMGNSGGTVTFGTIPGNGYGLPNFSYPPLNIPKPKTSTVPSTSVAKSVAGGPGVSTPITAVTTTTPTSVLGALTLASGSPNILIYGVMFVLLLVVIFIATER